MHLFGITFNGILIYFFALVSTCAFMTVSMGLTQNKPHCVFMVMKEHVIQCQCVAH